MLKKLLFTLTLASFLSFTQVFAAILVDKHGNSVHTKTKYKPISKGESLRNSRKVGLGLATAGVYGLMGLNMELNFTPRTGFMLGFGLANGFQTFSFQVKRIIGGHSFLPYISGGYARWYTTGRPDQRFDKTTPDILADKFLNEAEKAGEFAENLMFGSVGVQFIQLKGGYRGVSLFGEATLIVDIDDLVIAPIGSLGMTYYF